jgi:sortase A
LSRFELSEFKSKNLWSVALMVVGAVVLLYVLLQYGTMFAEQHRLARQWEQQNGATTAGVRTEAVSDGLTKVTIPKINLDAVVVEGTNRRQLLLGPGHMPDTPAPGEAGNSVITAHRDTFFRHIYELNKGDQIEVRRNGKLFTYEVTGKKVVQPEDMSVIKQSSDKRLTLITCYPTYYIGPAPERLVVFSKLVEQPEARVVTVKEPSQSPRAP